MQFEKSACINSFVIYCMISFRKLSCKINNKKLEIIIFQYLAYNFILNDSIHYYRVKRKEVYIGNYVFSDEGESIDATQEMLALGACNVVSAFVSSMPVSGGLSRGAVNHSSGVKTTLGGIYTGLLVLVSLQSFTPYLYFIPNAALAAIIIAAVIFMVELHVIKHIWRTKSMIFEFLLHSLNC